LPGFGRGTGGTLPAAAHQPGFSARFAFPLMFLPRAADIGTPARITLLSRLVTVPYFRPERLMISTPSPEVWQQMLGLPLHQRIGAAPEPLVEYIALVNQASGLPQQPYSINAPPDFQNEVQNAIEELPPVVQRLLEGSLLGVFFANDLGSSAITDVLTGPDGELVGALVVLDVAAFINRSANEWATWKENTPFIATSIMTLQAAIADPALDTRQSALQYLLLHEFGHVLTAGWATLPNWWQTLPDLRGPHPWPFFDLSWQMNQEGQLVPAPGQDFALRRYVAYYSGANLSTDDLLAVYAALEQTGFPSLYGATNVYDDFAESFANYVHVVLMQRHYQLRILCDGISIFEPEPFWQSERSLPKRQFMQAFLAPGNALPGGPAAIQSAAAVAAQGATSAMAG
jgi:hypothetical protein